MMEDVPCGDTNLVSSSTSLVCGDAEVGCLTQARASEELQTIHSKTKDTSQISDKAKTFKSAAVIINNTLESSEATKISAKLHIEWKFNLEKAPWWGGIFECVIKSAKRWVSILMTNSSPL